MNVYTEDLRKLCAVLFQDASELWKKDLKQALEAKWLLGHGDMHLWQMAIIELPLVEKVELELKDRIYLSSITPCIDAMSNALEQLKPWRKGPWHFLGVDLDAEWRSDWKWSRLEPHINWNQKTLLDVGSGNGYFLYRALGAGAKAALGIDPNWLFYHQFQVLKKYVPDLNTWQLPLCFENLPSSLPYFDVVMSMGVLYHRKDPIGHLMGLRNWLKPGGELILETLVVDGDAHTILMPEDRYAQMRNVWFLPSIQMIELWLRRSGYEEIQLLNVEITSVNEQRSTPWMTFQSLEDFLDSKNPSLTIEGYSAPKRAMWRVHKPLR